MAIKILSHNTRCYPSSGIDGFIVVATVLVAGDIGDYAAYTGHGTSEWVAERGDKISFEEACAQFSGLKKENYRR